MDEMPEIDVSWKRPAAVPPSRVWHRFTTRPKDGKTYDVRIEDVAEDRFEEVLDFLLKYYFPDEPLGASVKLIEDKISVMVYQYLSYKIMEQRVTIIAVLDEETPKPQIVGAQILSVSSKDDPLLPEVPGEAIQKMKKIYYDIRQNCDPFQILNTDRYLHEWGLCVAPEFRGLNVGFNILTSLKTIATTFGLVGSFIMFTRTESQVLAERAGFKEYNEIVYSEYKDKNGQVVFPVVGTKSLKFMGILYT